MEQKNIMIITPIDPMNILEISQDILLTYWLRADLICPQQLALYAEDNKYPYPVNNVAIVSAMRDNVGAAHQKNINYSSFIVLGNCDKNTTKFDHIVTVETWWKENKIDPYITKSDEVFDDAQHIDWFKYEDAEYSFPTVQHLKLFLKTLGVNANEI